MSHDASRYFQVPLPSFSTYASFAVFIYGCLLVLLMLERLTIHTGEKLVLLVFIPGRRSLRLPRRCPTLNAPLCARHSAERSVKDHYTYRTPHLVVPSESGLLRAIRAPFLLFQFCFYLSQLVIIFYLCSYK